MGVQFGNDPDMSARVVAACPALTTKPIVTKLSPNQTDIALNAKPCLEAATDAFAIINTISGMAIDAETRRPVIGNSKGGLSGSATKPIALLNIKEVAEVTRAHTAPTTGQAGITNATDTLEFVIASAVGIGTALFYDPLVCPKINAGIAAYFDRYGFESGEHLVGTLVAD